MPAVVRTLHPIPLSIFDSKISRCTSPHLFAHSLTSHKDSSNKYSDEHATTHKQQNPTPNIPDAFAPPESNLLPVATAVTNSTPPLILPPPIPTSHALEKTRHGLIRTPNLDLEKRSLISIASIRRTLRAAFLRIIPRAGPAKDVFFFFALKDAAREDWFGDCVFKGAGAAFETVGAVACEGDGENVGALGADCVC